MDFGELIGDLCDLCFKGFPFKRDFVFFGGVVDSVHIFSLLIILIVPLDLFCGSAPNISLM